MWGHGRALGLELWVLGLKRFNLQNKAGASGLGFAFVFGFVNLFGKTNLDRAKILHFINLIAKRGHGCEGELAGAFMPQFTKHSLIKMEQVFLSSAFRKPHNIPLYKGWRYGLVRPDSSVLKLCGNCVELDTAQDACMLSEFTDLDGMRECKLALVNRPACVKFCHWSRNYTGKWSRRF